jgi:probable HAF family extracellular repeat protein
MKVSTSNGGLAVCILAMLPGCGSQSPVTTVPPPGTSIRYSVEALTTQLGGGVAEGVSNRGWIVGSTNGLRGCCVSRAALWRNGNLTDLGTLGGPNSSEQWPVKDNRGLIAGVAETSKPDPLKEDFCTFGTGLICSASAGRTA